jgi:Xaa-Pro aminopeptidase/diacylglycerol kinase family enzyme
MTASPFGSLAVIANPHAGDGRVGRELSALERGLADRGLEYSLQLTDGPGDATRLATDAMDAGVRFLVAVGGDGTVQEVVNGMFRDGRPIVEDPVLGLVPAHSGCDLVKSFGLPGDVDAACGHLLGDNTYPFDVVKVAFTDAGGEPAVRYSVNLAEIGFGAAVAARTAGRPGRTRAFVAFWSTFIRTRVRTFGSRRSQRVRGAGVQRDRGQRAVRVGGMRLSPRSFPGDGVADVLVFTAHDRTRTLVAGDVPSRRPRPASAHPGAAREDPRVDRRRPSPARRRGRRDARHHARDVPGDPSIDPAEAMTADHETRRERLAAELAEDRLAAVVVAPSPDLVYLTGYGPMPLERLTALVIRPDGAAVLVVPALERQLALDSAAGQTLETNQVVGWRDGDDPYDLVASILPREGRVAIGDRIWASHVLALQRTAPALAFEPASRIIGRLRAVKDPDELGALRRAGRGADEAFRQICGTRFLGRREEEIAEDLAALLLEHGHSRADFTIVASGPNAASPHHEPSGRTIYPKDVVVMDFGGEVGGYFSDTTRTVVVGEAPAGFEEVYRLVQEAQDAAVRTVRPGVTAQEVDRAARRIIDTAGYGERFFHRTGHGIGLEVHEPPYIIEGNETVLTPGMTFSVEPGVYLEGRFGVRIEDIVAVTADGVERLNRSSRELQTVD